MALVFADRVQETTTTGFSGTGDVQLNGVPANPLGRVSFADGVGDGNRCKFLIDDTQGNWEISEGAVSTTSSPVTLTRDRVISSSASGAKVNFLAGMKDVTLVATSEDVGRSPHGQCRLTRPASALRLSRYDGKWLIIDGVARAVPAAGVDIPSTGLGADTTYFIYAAMSGDAMVLEASATGHELDSATGIETKSGDTSRTLVGMARTNASSQYADGDTQVFVISWFNRELKLGRRFDATSYAASTTAWTEPSTSLRVEFICWDKQAKAQVQCSTTASSPNAAGDVTVGIDGPAKPAGPQAFRQESGSNNVNGAMTSTSYDSTHYSEGYHFATVLFRHQISNVAVFDSETQVEVWG